MTDKDTRMIETFIDNGSGKEIPYWTLNNLSKLKEQDDVDDKNGFMDTINQEELDMLLHALITLILGLHPLSHFLLICGTLNILILRVFFQLMT